MIGYETWRLFGHGYSVVHQSRREGLTIRSVVHALCERLTDSLRYRAVDLPVHDHRIDNPSAVETATYLIILASPVSLSTSTTTT